MKQFLGQFIDDPNQIPGFPTLVLMADGTSTTEEIIHLGQVFEDLYKQHSSILVQTVFELNFSRYVIFFSVQTLCKEQVYILLTLIFLHEKLISNIE